MNLPTIAPDKLLHAVAGSYAALIGALAAWYLTLPPANGALAATLAAAVGKEAWDHFHDKAPELRDVAATVLGALPVCVVALA